ncbi:DUF6299 family protein [Streptomyces sp. NPDC001985]|uniref:DUF6299 family protein n=1 Tax=Streptomyces sp. NPDC001985 TaxID=3154406 RepID=UPI0033280A75
MINARRTTLLSTVCIAAALITGLTPGSAGAQFAPDTITITPQGRIAQDGTLTLSGTYRCSSLRSGPVLIGSNAVQGSARAEIDGALATCDDRTHTWRETTDPSGAFTPGSARGEAVLIELDSSNGFVPLPVILNTARSEITLSRG